MNPGRDADGIYRHIARDVTTPSILTHGAVKELHWPQICKILVDTSTKDRTKVCIADSVVVERGTISAYLYTSPGGYVKNKNVKDHTFPVVKMNFQKFAQKIGSADSTNVAVLHRAGSDTSTILNQDTFIGLCDNSSPLDEAVLQCYIPSKGNMNAYRTYRGHRWLDRNATVLKHVDRLDLSTGVTGTSSSSSKTSMDRHINEEIEATIHELVSKVENHTKGRVVRIAADLVQDANGRMWLLNTANCLVASERIPEKRVVSPDSFKMYHSVQAGFYGSGSGDLPLTPDAPRADSASGMARSQPLPNLALGSSLEAASQEALFARMRGASPEHHLAKSLDVLGDGGRHVEGRLRSRRQKDRAPDPPDDLINEIVKETQERALSRGSFYQRLSPIRKRSPEKVSAVYMRERTLAKEKEKNVIKEIKANSAASVQAIQGGTGTSTSFEGGRSKSSHQTYDSSQLSGCQGDFCHLDMSYLEDNSSQVSEPGVPLDKATKASAKAAFRKRLMDQEPAANPPVVTATPRTFSADEQGLVHTTDVDAALEMNKKLREEGSKATNVQASKMIPFRNVALARQESSLVKLLLKRHRHGRGGSYVSEDNFSDMKMTSSWPAQYYKDVPCCQNCFTVYNIVFDARKHAMDQIEEKRAEERLRRTGGRAGRSQSPEKKVENGIDTSANVSQESAPSLDSGGAVNTSMDLDSRRHLQAAMKAIDSLNKHDVAELRSMASPPLPVEVVVEAVMCLLTGKVVTFQQSRRLLAGGESFLLMLRELRLEDVNDHRLRLVEPYVGNPLFRPENVAPISICAAKFCAWVLGVVQAVHWRRGIGHKRTDTVTTSMQIPRQTDGTRKLGGSLSKRAIQSQRNDPIDDGNLSFIQKFERQKVKRMLQESKENSDGDGGVTGIGRGSESVDMSRNSKRKLRTQVAAARSTGESPSKILKRSRDEAESHADSKSDSKDLDSIERSKKRETAVRRKARNLAQKKASERLASIESTDNNPANSSLKEFKCADGLTRMPYVVLGALSLTEEAQRNVNFVVVHDFFDTYDGTAIMFKGICQRHFGCQVLCFNYPGQAYTVWPRLSPAERERGGTEPVFSNDWVADRLHELLQHVEDEGDMLLANPFHIVGIGNGANIAAAFCQRYGSTVHYANSLRSLVSINGFLHVDPQLSSILHSASQVFESTPHVRPDIPISFWSRFLFSEDYLNRVNLNLALNIYTAVANPITNEGRMKIARGALHHRDMQLGLSPDHLQVAAEQSFVVAMPIARVQVPVIVLQSTEDSLINPSNVDAYLAGRNTKHLWSHQLNMVYSAHRPDMDETTAWVGKLSTGPADYAKFSSLGKSGLKMVIDSLANPRGAFVLWSRTGHSIYQESKGVVLDLLDILALPTEDYCGLAVTEEEIRTAKNKEIEQQASEFTDLNEVQHITSKMEVLFKLAPSKSVPVELPGEETVEEAVVSTEEQGMDLDDILKEVIEVVDNEAEIRETNDSPQEFAETSQPSNNILTDEAVEPSTDRPDNEENEEEDDDQPIDGPNLASSEEAAHGQIDSHEGGDIEEALAQMEADDIPDSREEIVKEELDLEDPSTQGESNTEKDEQLEDNVAAEMDLGSKLRQIEEAAMAAADEVPPAVVDPPAKEIIASEAQRAKREWADEEKIPAVSQVIELENELARRNAEFAELQEKLETRKAQDAAETLRKFEEEQAQRRKQYEEEDRMLLERLQAELEQRRQEREMNERQRRLQLQGIEDALMHTGLIAETKNDSESVDSLPAERQPVKEMPPMTYASPGPLPAVVTESGDILGQLDSMKNDEEDARRKGILSMEEYDKMKKQVAQRQMEREEKMRHLGLGEQNDLLNDCAISIQRVIRGFVGRAVAKRAHDARELDRKASRGIITLQAIVRGAILRKKQALIKRTVMLNLQKQHGIVLIQSVFRGYLGRRFVRHLRRELSARTLQRTFRGHLGRQAANRERARLELLKKKQNAAMTIQSTWRMKVAKEEFRSLRIHMLAAIEIQRCHRGYLGRKLMKRRRKWESTPAGPERIKLGLEFIEESKLAFERQQEEIDALHRAQEKAEARVSRIHTDLKESEKELVVLQRELQEIDQIEKELQTLTHERDLLQQGVKDAVGMPRTAQRGRTDIVMGREASAEHDPEAARRRQAQAYALELTIQIKRAEREKKRQELETEFATVFQEVERKKKALERLEEALADMESTRERKDREFRRLQKNLMQLLLEQKQELDDLREKGIELETATATTAAAATATAMKAKEHEKRATAMFSQTEELMKFQMMSMSLSHLSALNMLKQFRDMNQDTTSAAIASSADAAAAAAAAATAANLPSVKKLDLGANDFIELSLQKKKAELQAAEFAEKEAKVAREQPMPDNIRMWSVSDVCRWLETLSMGQYGAAFSEALVDGQFLLDLREEDLVQVLGIKHKLHVRKILISRERLRPLNERERGLYDQTMVEEQAAEARKEIGMPDIDTVFSQARNGRIKRVEESINMGFDVNSEDERGNTLLLVAAQNSNKRLVEMLLIRGANINHQNAQGNTSLHFALRSDADGPLPEYLIEHGADDSIENIDGLTPYD